MTLLSPSRSECGADYRAVPMPRVLSNARYDKMKYLTSHKLTVLSRILYSIHSPKLAIFHPPKVSFRTKKKTRFVIMFIVFNAGSRGGRKLPKINIIVCVPM
jgi:hypothetical protein